MAEKKLLAYKIVVKKLGDVQLLSEDMAVDNIDTFQIIWLKIFFN